MIGLSHLGYPVAAPALGGPPRTYELEVEFHRLQV